MVFCEQYIIGANSMLVEMPFLARIKEGEMNCSCVGFTSQLELADDVAKDIIDCIGSKVSVTV